MENIKDNFNSLTYKQKLGALLGVIAIGFIGFAAHEDVKQQNARDMQYIATRTDSNQFPIDTK
jgi:hypothetical protein